MSDNYCKFLLDTFKDKIGRVILIHDNDSYNITRKFEHPENQLNVKCVITTKSIDKNTGFESDEYPYTKIRPDHIYGSPFVVSNGEVHNTNKVQRENLMDDINGLFV